MLRFRLKHPIRGTAYDEAGGEVDIEVASGSIVSALHLVGAGAGKPGSVVVVEHNGARFSMSLVDLLDRAELVSGPPR